MAINYSSTRGGENNVTASMAILKGLAADGGLFMPAVIPHADLERYANFRSARSPNCPAT